VWSSLSLWKRCAALLLAIASPIGAPAVAWIILLATGAGWDEPIYSRPSAILDYFMAFLFAPFAWIGPFPAFIWIAVGLTLICALAWAIASGALRAIAERI
jgi:hypothetical protein